MLERAVQAVKEHLDLFEDYRRTEAHIKDAVPETLWNLYQQLQAKVESHQAVVKKILRDGKQTVTLDGFQFGVYTQKRHKQKPEVTEIIAEQEHFQILYEYGAIKEVKLDESKLHRLPPELAGIYQNLFTDTETQVVRWDKRIKI